MGGIFAASSLDRGAICQCEFQVHAAASEVGTLWRGIRLDGDASGMSLSGQLQFALFLFFRCQSLKVSFFRAARLALTALRKKQRRKSYSDGLTRTSTLTCYAPP